MLSADGFLAGGREALCLPEGDGLGILPDAAQREIIIALSLHGCPDIGDDLRADALTLQLAIHHEPADEGVIPLGIAGDEVEDSDKPLVIVEAHKELVLGAGAAGNLADDFGETFLGGDSAQIAIIALVGAAEAIDIGDVRLSDAADVVAGGEGLNVQRSGMLALELMASRN